MYKVLFVSDSSASQMESELNSAAEDGWEYLNSFQQPGRIIILMRLAPVRGRPRKVEENENKLGD